MPGGIFSRIWMVGLLVLSGLSLHAQVITGNVKDEKTGLPLPFTNVFVNNTTIGAVTDAKGNYRISGNLPSNLELAASFVGYYAKFRKVSVQGRSLITVNFELIPKEESLSEVTLKTKRDKKWEKYMRRFERVFLAVPDDPFFSQVKIKNPWVVDFEEGRLSSGKRYLAASASQPIIIENQAMGYDIEYHLQEFVETVGGFHYFGLANFQPMEPAGTEEDNYWEDARNSAYFGSLKHFLYSIIHPGFRDDGFVLYEVTYPPMGQMRTNRFHEEVGKTLRPITVDSLSIEAIPGGFFRIRWPEKVEVHFTKKFWTNDYYTRINHAISWLEAPLGYFDVDEDGVLLDPQQVVRSGNMGRERMARFVPMDFVPEQSSRPLLAEVVAEKLEELKWANLLEKPYLSLNKSVYYPGETIWLQTHMLYHNTLFADTLSRTVYVDLVNDQLETVKSELFYVENGQAHGQLILEDDFPEGKYALVAYTNWMRNYQDSPPTVKYVSVLPRGKWPVINREAMEEADETGTEVGLQIEPTSVVEHDGANAKGKFTVQVKDYNDRPVQTALSVSLVDANLADFLPDGDLNTAMDWLYAAPETVPDAGPAYKIEYGLPLEGRYSNGKNKEKAVPITVVVGELEDYGIIRSDSLGHFYSSAMHFYDSAEVAVASLDDKRRRRGSVELISVARPNHSFEFDHSPVPLEDQPLLMTWLDKYAGQKIIDLAEVKVEDQRIQTMEDNFFGYGKGDVTIGQSFLQRFPEKPIADIVEMNFSGGIMMRQNWGQQTDMPLVMVDGVVLFGDQVLQELEGMIGSEVESIEVYTYSATIFGVRGYAGAISIITKKGKRKLAKSPYEFDKSEFQLFKVFGFTMPMEFPQNQSATEPVLSKPTLYWNPSAVTDEADGKYQFEVHLPATTEKVYLKIEGLSEEGFPFRKIFELELSRN